MDAPGLAQITGPRVETTVVAMELRGVGALDMIAVPDLDIIERNDGLRLLPLLRLLRGLGLEPLDSASVLTFVPDGASIVTVDYAAGIASIDGRSISVPMAAGISDITNQPELYVEESAVAAMLAMQVTWDARLYEYRIQAKRPLRIFDRRREGAWLARRSAFASFDLPGHLPPARARRSVLPTLQLAEIQMLSSLTARPQTQGVTGSLAAPRVGVWADVLGGSLAARMSERNSNGRKGYRAEQLSWSASLDQTALSVGSVNLGLSELVFPSISLIGAVANGRKGAPLDARDPSQLGRQQAFLPLRVFDGYARLGSEVTLSINGQDVETRTVEPGPNAPPGDGPYRFEGVNLFSSRLNDVRIRVAAPDGSVEDIRRRVLGTDLLMDAGDFAFIGGFGGRRNPSSDNFAPDGRFGGGRFNLGISRRASLGMSAAYQDRLYRSDSLFYFGGAAPIRPPSRSVHLGSRLAWQPSDPLLLSTEAARSQSLPDSATNWAIRADAEYQLGELHLHPAVFHYGPTFFDGQNPEQRDLAGSSMGLLWRYGRGNQIALGGSRTHDVLADGSNPALRSSEVQASWSVRGIVPRSVLTLGGRRIWISDAPALRTGLIGLEGNLPWGWTLRGHHEFGDDIHRALGERLAGGSTWRFDFSNRMSSAPGGGTGIGVGAQTSALELRRRINDAWQVTLAHQTFGTFRRSSIDLSRTASADGFWQARLSPGYEWDGRSAFLQDRVELFLTKNRSNRLVLEHQLLHHEWFVRLSLQLQTDVGFAGARPVPLFDSRLDPGSGGVKGRVFLDSNGNGLADPGEPGLGGVEVTTDQGRRAVSANSGLFVISNSSSVRRTRVSLEPETLPATYTLTQATQEAILRPGEFTEVNLGIAVLGSISGAVVARPAPGGRAGKSEMTGVSGVRVVLVDPAGQEAANSITGHDGGFTLSDIRPGHYVVRPDSSTLPDDLVLESSEIPLEVKSQVDPFERKGLTFTGRYSVRELTAERVEDRAGVVYKVFSHSGISATPERAEAKAPAKAREPAGSAVPDLLPAPVAPAQPPPGSPATVAPEAKAPAKAREPAGSAVPDLPPAPVAPAQPPPGSPGTVAPGPAGAASQQPEYEEFSRSRIPDAAPEPASPSPEPATRPDTTVAPERTPVEPPTTTRGSSTAPVAVVAPAEAPTPEPAAADSTEAAPAVPDVADAESRLRLAYGRKLPAPLPGGSQAATCECEVEGTVEVRSDRPLSRPVLITVSIADAPAFRDSIELFMGSPRLLRLGRVPCGSHELSITASSPKRFKLISGPLTINCLADRLRQFRVVLEPK